MKATTVKTRNESRPAVKDQTASMAEIPNWTRHWIECPIEREGNIGVSVTQPKHCHHPPPPTANCPGFHAQGATNWWYVFCETSIELVGRVFAVGVD
jgi:hypothetical protein